MLNFLIHNINTYKLFSELIDLRTRIFEKHFWINDYVNPDLGFWIPPPPTSPVYFDKVLDAQIRFWKKQYNSVHNKLIKFKILFQI